MSNQSTSDLVKRLADIVDKSETAVFFGGAGVSTESGIADFRSGDGLYSVKEAYGYAPEELLSSHILQNEPAVFYKYAKENLIPTDAHPNKAHLALALLEELGKLQAVITQNIDGLHQRAGSENVYELHGSMYNNYCVACGATYDIDYIMAPENTTDGVPRCSKCDGMVRPDVVMYGESLNNEVINGAMEAIRTADTLIVGGTSLAVYPAAGMVQFFDGDNLVLINKTPTPLDSDADLVIHDSVGEMFGLAMHQLGHDI